MRVAILDMYNNLPGKHGIRCITDWLGSYDFITEINMFNVRAKHEIPSLEYDIYIGSGGPGNPLELDLNWTPAYYNLIDNLTDHNGRNPNDPKYFFAICHSFQMLCAHFNLGQIVKRDRFTFGLTKISKSSNGQFDPLLNDLEDEFEAAEFRYFSVINPIKISLIKTGAEILALESFPPNTSGNHEIAIMSVKFSDYVYGTQFHPEADRPGMLSNLRSEHTRPELLKSFSALELDQLDVIFSTTNSIAQINKTILPNFMKIVTETQGSLTGKN